MLTMFDSFALTELREQVGALDRALRQIGAEARGRMEAFDPGEPESEFEADLISSASDALVDDLALADSVLRQTMGVVMVLIHGHVEQGLRRLFKATRGGREIGSIRWAGICGEFLSAGIDMPSKPGYETVNTVRNLSNLYKHSGGVATKDIALPDGRILQEGARADYSEFDYPSLAEAAIEFLRAVAEDANRPGAPPGTVAPEMAIEIGPLGEHVFRRVPRRSFAPVDEPWAIEVQCLVCDGRHRNAVPLMSILGDEAAIPDPGLASGTKALYWFQAVNSRNERGRRSTSHEVVQS